MNSEQRRMYRELISNILDGRASCLAVYDATNYNHNVNRLYTFYLKQHYPNYFDVFTGLFLMSTWEFGKLPMSDKIAFRLKVVKQFIRDNSQEIAELI